MIQALERKACLCVPNDVYNNIGLKFLGDNCRFSHYELSAEVIQNREWHETHLQRFEALFYRSQVVAKPRADIHFASAVEIVGERTRTWK
jgi:hypothetical protein